MESLSYSLTIQDLKVFYRGSADITALLHNLFTPGSNNYQQLAYELQREFKQGGSPQVTSIRFDRVNYDAQTLKGSLRIVLNVNFTFGCEDVTTEKKDQTSEWTFELNRKNESISFYSSPFAVERSTADEF